MRAGGDGRADFPEMLAQRNIAGTKLGRNRMTDAFKKPGRAEAEAHRITEFADADLREYIHRGLSMRYEPRGASALRSGASGIWISPENG